MFGHRSFLVLGGGAADILSLIKGGYEILNCNFAFQQGIDDKGKATTRVYGGTINATLSQLPTVDIISWALNPRKYQSGLIVMLDANNIPVDKIIFQDAACLDMVINYTQSDDSYAATSLVIQAQKLIVGNGIPFDNEWTL